MAAKFDPQTLSLKLYNTETRAKEVVAPRKGEAITLYTCGPTVYDYAHIGNYRTYVFEDLLRRTLKFFGAQVVQVMNITDVDDKTIRGAIREKVSLVEYTKRYKEAFFADLKTLNIEPVEHYPEATAYVGEMIAMIEGLLEKGIAYKGGDGSVYYAIDRFPKYGRLSHLNRDDLKAGASERVATDEYDKENISDFVLWKALDPERDGNIFWESPFGPGRPGWHLECSTMATKLLGATLDIHCGGVDNIFPHHENEIAQSEAFTGKTFVRHWMHSEHLIVDNKKMSKSLGNFHTLRNLLDKGWTGRQVRYMLLQSHYKTQLNFTFEGLDAVQHALQRLHDFIIRMRGVEVPASEGLVAPILDNAHRAFATALADDLNISVAFAALFDMVREINALSDRGNISKDEAEHVLDMLNRFDTVLGVFNFEDEAIPPELVEALDKRVQARKVKDWAAADRLRDFIQERGYVIEDTSGGARLKKAR